MALRVLTIGAGFFAQLHVDGWARNGDAEPVCIVDQSPEKARELRDRYAPSAEVFASAAEAVQAIEPDIVDIATPPATHAEMIAIADQISPKAIICQKPFCGSLDAAKAAVRETKSPLIVHENFRFQPWYRAVQNLLAAGRIGQPYQMTFRFRPGDGQGPRAYLERQPYFQKMNRFLIHETGIHWVDTFRFLFGEPRAVSADLRQLNRAIAGEDSGQFTLAYDGGFRAIFDGNRLSDHVADNPRLTLGEALLEGEKGSLALSGNGDIHFRAFSSAKRARVFHCKAKDRFGADCVFAFQKHVTDHLLHGGALETGAQDYLRNLEIEEAIYRANATGQKQSLLP